MCINWIWTLRVLLFFCYSLIYFAELSTTNLQNKFSNAELDFLCLRLDFEQEPACHTVNHEVRVVNWGWRVELRSMIVERSLTHMICYLHFYVLKVHVGSKSSPSEIMGPHMLGLQSMTCMTVWPMFVFIKIIQGGKIILWWCLYYVSIYVGTLHGQSGYCKGCIFGW